MQKASSLVNAGSSVQIAPQLKYLFGAFVLITLGLSPWLWGYFRFSFSNDLYSHVILMPAVTGYLIWIANPVAETKPGASRLWSIIPLTLVLLGVCFSLWGNLVATEDRMAALAAVYVGLIWAAATIILGPSLLRQTAFPLAMLVFMIPFPVAVEQGIEFLLQHGSAECAYWMFRLSGMTLFRDELVFHLPGISMQVAPQCSGIRSSLVLFITSVIGGYLFLRTTKRRVALALFVIPLALVRNGFRVFVLGELCVKIGPHMIDSWVHHRGGPVFFALSLIPFMAVLWVLKRSERAS